MSIPCYRVQNKGQMAKSPELSVSVLLHGSKLGEHIDIHWPSRLSTILCSIFFIRSSIWLIRFWASISFNRISVSTSANWDAKAAASPEARRKRTYKLSFQKMPTCHDAVQHYGRTLVQNWLCMTHPSTSLLMHFTPLQKNLGSQSALNMLLSDCSPYHSPLPSRWWREHPPGSKIVENMRCWCLSVSSVSGSLATQGHLRLVGVTYDSKIGSLVPTGFFKGNTFRVKVGAYSPALGGDTGTWGLRVGLKKTEENPRSQTLQPIKHDMTCSSSQ